jgi:hypothetical protein
MGRQLKRPKKKKSKLTAKTADRFWLYENSVYMPEADYEFLQRIFKRVRGRKPMLLREDFAGTSQLAALWVKNDKSARAWAVDLDPEPLAWGFKRHIEPLGEAASRVEQRKENVLDVDVGTVDVITAFNFSYWIFEERATMLDYFRRVHAALGDDGMVVVDLMGGPGAQSETEEEREENGFDYVWEQEAMDAITHHMECHIHFHFADGSKMRNAFSYSWRLWSVAELRDVMLEAGVASVDVYWEGTDEDGEGDGVFRKKKHAENEETWIAYLAAWK